MSKKNPNDDFRWVPVVSKGRLHEIDEATNDILYWLSRPVEERLAAVTFLVSQQLNEGERMDKTIVRKMKMHRHDSR